MKLGPGGELRRPGSSGVDLPSIEGGRQFAPPAGVPRPPFNTSYPPPKPDFEADQDLNSSLPEDVFAANALEPEPEPQQDYPGGVMAEESAPGKKATMERKVRPKNDSRPKSPEFKVSHIPTTKT